MHGAAMANELHEKQQGGEKCTLLCLEWVLPMVSLQLVAVIASVAANSEKINPES